MRLQQEGETMGRLPKVNLNNNAYSENKNAEKTLLPAIRDTTNELDTQGNSEFGITNTRVHLRLNSITNARRSMAAIVRAVNRGDITHEEARSYAYQLQILSGLFRAEQELNLSREIEQLKQMLSDIQNGGGELT